MPSTVRDIVIQNNLWVHVAVGVITDAKGRVLIAQRSEHSHQGGKWEFPGGKLQPQEDAASALKRELEEELGINVQKLQALIEIPYHYPDKPVILHVWRVIEYKGEPHGREGQPIRWCAINDLSDEDFPAANQAIIHALLLPSVYAISNAKFYGKETFLHKLESVLNAGLRLLQWREPQLNPQEFQDYTPVVMELCHRYGAKLLFNTDAQTALDYGADGVHLNSARLMAQKERPVEKELWFSASCHNSKELQHAAKLDADFVALSPVLLTASHPHALPLGWQGFRDLCVQAPMPVYALGGMRSEHLTSAQMAGAQGLAMLSGIWEKDIKNIFSETTMSQE